MNQIHSLLKTARRRLEFSSLLDKVHLVAIAVGLAVVGLLAVERLGQATFVPWIWVLPAVVALGLIVAGWLWFAARLSVLQVAVEVDDRLDLREKLSTALHCQQRDDPFARAAIEDAVAAAKSPQVREQVRRRFPVTSPARWWLSPLIVLLALGVSFLPPLDLFAADENGADSTAQLAKLQGEEAIEAVLKPIEESPELRNELGDLLGDLTKQGTDPDALKTRQDVKRNAIKKLTDINKRLDEIINGPKGKTADAVERALKQLRTPQDGPAKELADALAAGDFAAAQQALAKLKAELENGQLDEQQKRQLAQQLDDLAQQMQQLAQQQQQLEDLLKQAGLNPQLAQNPQALQQALQDNPNLNDQQRQQLQQLAQAQQAAAGMCQGLGQGLGQMAQGIMAGQLGQAGQPLGDQLNQLEAMQQLLQQARAAANACQGQCRGLGQGLGMQQALQQWMQGRGGAFGNRGQGAGGKALIAPTPTGTKIVSSPSQTTPGDIIARQFIDGPQIVGESQAKLRQVVSVVSEGFDEALGEDQLPRKYYDAHLHYFGELKQRVEAVEEADEESAEPATADEPESDD